MKPYYDHAGVTIYHGDCRELLSDMDADLVLTDPPYGIGWRPRVNNLASPWSDKTTVDLSPMMLIGSRHCIWGGNYYTRQLLPTESWLIWLKRPAGFDDDPRTYATCEMAWSDFGGKPRTRTHVWDGGKRQGESINRAFDHPAQKPIELMRWCIAISGTQGAVLDPFCGSGTTLWAAKNMGRKAIGIEIEECYCEIAARRCEQEVLDLR